jgi:hypothetical protein
MPGCSFLDPFHICVITFWIKYISEPYFCFFTFIVADKPTQDADDCCFLKAQHIEKDLAYDRSLGRPRRTKNQVDYPL